MRIDQRVYLHVFSDVYNPDEITARLGALPDKVLWRASRSSQPRVPVTNIWTLGPLSAGPVDGMIEAVVQRIEPFGTRLQALCEGDAASAQILVARFFGYPDGVEDTGNYDPDPGEEPGGQHQLLGFGLDDAILRRLAEWRCSLMFDEYG